MIDDWFVSLFRYKWNFAKLGMDRRLDFFESNWAFFAGFGNIYLFLIHVILCHPFLFCVSPFSNSNHLILNDIFRFTQLVFIRSQNLLERIVKRIKSLFANYHVSGVSQSLTNTLCMNTIKRLL